MMPNPTPPQPLTTHLTNLISKLESDGLTLNLNPTTTSPATAIDELGTLARSPEWRAPLAGAGAIDYALQVLDSAETDRPLRRSCYRLLANTCADEHESREELSRHWALFLRCFEWDLLGATREDGDGDAEGGVRNVGGAACAAMLNFLTDNEEAADLVLGSRLVVILAGSMRAAHERCRRVQGAEVYPANFWDVVLDVLERATKVEDLGIDALQLTTALLDGFDDCCGFPDDEPEDWVMVLSKLFGEDRVRREFATNRERFVQLLRMHHSVQEQYVEGSSDELERRYMPPQKVDPQSLVDMANLNGPLQRNRTTTNMWIILSMVVEEDVFPTTYSSLEGTVPHDLIHWIKLSEPGQGRNESQLQLAMLIIGNLSRSPQYPQFLEEVQMADRLYGPVNETTEDQTRMLGLDLLKHCFLNQPVTTKDPALAKARSGLVLGLNAAMGLNWMTAHASLSLARLLLTPNNIEQILEPDSLNNAMVGDSEPASYLQRAMQLFLAKSDIPDLKVDVGRLVAAILRNAYSGSSQESAPESHPKYVADLLAVTLDLAEPLGYMVTVGTEDGTKMMMNGEGWFGMALLAKSKQGAESVLSVLGQPDVQKAFQAALAPEQDTKGLATQQAHRRQNVLVMVRHMQRQGIDLRDAGITQSIEQLMAGLQMDDLVS